MVASTTSTERLNSDVMAQIPITQGNSWGWLGEKLAPEFLALLLWIQLADPLYADPVQSLGLGLMIGLVLRWSWQGAMLLHGFGHTLCRTLVDRQAAAFTWANLLEHRSPRQVFAALWPLATCFVSSPQSPSRPWLGVGDRTPWKVRLKASGGLVLNLAGLGLGLYLGAGVNPLQPGLVGASQVPSLAMLGYAFGLANGLMLMTSQSDWRTLITGQGDRLYCGNFGFISQGETAKAGDLISDHGNKLFAIMGQETEVRGEQAGGGLVFARDLLGYTHFVGHKLVKAKRGKLTTALASTFTRIRQEARRSGLRPMAATMVGAWHYRFGTSGPPSVLETHWHEWSPARLEPVWALDKGHWQVRRQLVNHRITHNGDFDGWLLFGQLVDYVSLGLWLERVLHVPNQTVGDSPKIAAMIDLLVTQGMWLPSVRLAYQTTLATDLRAAFGGDSPSKTAAATAPSPDQLQRWADRFEAAFVTHLKTLAAAEQLPNLPGQQWLHQTLMGTLSQDESLGQVPTEQLGAFIQMTLEVFLRNDLYEATRLFMQRAQGSFGLVVLSTLNPDQIMLSSLGQPISLGFDPNQGYAVYASEPAAIDGVLGKRPGAYRLDLNQNTGEVAVLKATAVTVYSMTENREVRDTELFQRRLTYPILHQSRYPASDPVAQDLQDIPDLFRQIKDTWLNPASGNRQSAEYLANFLIAKAHYLQQKQEQLTSLGLDPSLAKSNHVDLLITGVENSLWVGEQFARDLERLLPLLSIKVLSANQILQKLQYDFSGLGLAKQSLVLAITQSGQTFPTRQVLEACDLLVRQGVMREFFVLTGEPTSFLGSSLLTPTFAGEPFSRRLFTNGSGRRVAEPATASVAATHQTLTELLLYLSHQLQIAFPDQKPLGLTISPDGLAVLDDIDNEFLLQTTEDMLGMNHRGQDRPSRLHRQIVEAGQKWALHIIETPLAWGIHALYVAVTVGWAILFGYAIPLAQTLYQGMLAVLNLSPETGLASVLATFFQIDDIIIYIFGPWFWTLGLRFLQKRPLLARTGKRTLVLGDTPWVRKTLENYVSKLFSLSYGIATLEVHGANPQDELVHGFAHRVVRGTLLFLGVPDGRRSQKQQSEESAVILSARQANGIRNLGVGPEIVTLGSNPLIAHQKFATALLLPGLTSAVGTPSGQSPLTSDLLETLRESRFNSLQRLLASYLFFWAMTRRVATLPLLGYDFWKSQSRTKVMTTAAPVSAPTLDRPEPEEVLNLELARLSRQEQS